VALAEVAAVANRVADRQVAELPSNSIFNPVIAATCPL
jgi:hypothetical protein